LHMGYSRLNKHSIGIEIVNAGWFRKSGSNYVRDRIVKSESEMPTMEPHAHARVGSGTFWWPSYTDKQLEVLDDVTQGIISEYNILDITTHEQIDTRGWKTDPGPAFPLERYKRLLMTTQNDRSVDSDKYEVAASRLNVRNGPGTSFEVINSVSRGQIVEVIDKRNDWARIDIDGNDDGWVSDAYIRRA
jgi:N-acetylmuramoyl-L-alanine amidase